MSDAPMFWNRIADNYARQPIGDLTAYQHKLSATSALLKPDMHLLEFGCGTGSTALVHAPNVRSIQAIDFSGEMIRIAKEKANTAGVENVGFQVQSIDTLEAKENSFDAILGMSILHLLPNRQEVIAKVFNLLKPGGHFFSSTLCIGDGNPIIPMVLPLIRALGKAPYVGKFTSVELLAELEQAGFTIKEQWRPKKSGALFVIANKS